VPSILVETHAHKPYEQRVRANRTFLDALVKRIAEDPGALVAAVENGWERTVELGRTDAPPSRVALVYEEEPAAQSISWPAYEWYFDDSRLFGKVLRFRRGEVREVDVPWYHRSRVAADVERPRGYLVLPGWPQITSRLLAHGLRVRCLAEESTVAAETMRLSDAEFAGRSYQGRTSVSARVMRAVEKRTMPPGTLWVPADQPAFEVAVQLLEPEGKDSLFSWGVISSVVETKEYIELGRLSEFADEALRSDPAAREAWELALSDPSFSNDQRSRYLWWYRRTPHWNEQAGLMPVFRVMHPPDFAISELADTP
jgi:hypothetical protein